ncbi:hypothetical protein [Roseibium salinum]|uniref:Uncharacterized protein n=1 Tax=Roseibium salinum TaxID=1604349 RepID=A0ABT3R9M5_9HYPH|nr:hypothetical protein [Roseibium sp. DSM 29163]MCX2725764.1 hypothetical protein [Roseibium sp. DSM 29163]
MPKFNSVAYRHANRFVTAVIGLGITLTSAVAAGSTCNGVKVDLTKSRKETYAPLVAAAMNNKIKPARVQFSAIMESGDWSAAYISSPESDNGVMFFQSVAGKKHFREVWGGWAEPSERPELVAWAKKLGAPADLAKCFAETVTDHE